MNHIEYEGLDENQNSYFWVELDNILSRMGENAKISRDTLREYDERICRYVKQIGQNRRCDFHIARKNGTYGDVPYKRSFRISPNRG